MKLKKLLIIFFAFLNIAAYADLSVSDLREKSMQNVDIIKKIADAKEAWIAEKNELNARLASRKTLNERIKKEIAQSYQKSEKSKNASSEILSSLEDFKAFEQKLASDLQKSTNSFVEKIQLSPASYLFKNQSNLEGTFKDVYSYAEAAIEERIFALKLSKELTIQSVEGEDALFIGICAFLKKSECDNLSEIIDILNGKSAHKIISISIERDKK